MSPVKNSYPVIGYENLSQPTQPAVTLRAGQILMEQAARHTLLSGAPHIHQWPVAILQFVLGKLWQPCVAVWWEAGLPGGQRLDLVLLVQ